MLPKPKTRRTSCSLYCTLNCRVLSVMVCPSVADNWLGQDCRPGQRHCRSTQGVSYKSTLLHTVQGLHSGRSSSWFCTNNADFQIHSKQKLFPPFNSMVTPCCLVQCFGEISHLHLQTRNAVRTGKKVIQVQRDYAVVTTEVPQSRYLSTKLHSVTSEETIILICVTLVLFVTDCVLFIPVTYMVFYVVVGCQLPLSRLFCLGKACCEVYVGIIFVVFLQTWGYL
jgi:hypothetical protein